MKSEELRFGVIGGNIITREQTGEEFLEEWKECCETLKRWLLDYRDSEGRQVFTEKEQGYLEEPEE